ncbi:DUF4834 domain-containing protein [Aureisphaera galaxeae]|uniref:DUF4834 domain-containing protein n=1 Tax=Aureisphaera galaxeae TaxID=1538023 RepID=UPI00300FE28C
MKTILIILLVYFGLKFLFRLLAPYAMRYIAKKAAQRFENAFGQAPFNDAGATYTQPNPSKSADDIPKSNGKVVGEYIDFEEID